VTAHYGPIDITAEASVEVLRSPLPVACSRRDVVLVSQRTVGRTLLLFGAAAPIDFGRVVSALAEGVHGRRVREVASGKVGAEGYFLLKVPLARGARAHERYLVAVEGQRSNALQPPGVLQIAADSSTPARSQVTLRLARGLRSAATVTISHLDECVAGPPYLVTRLAPGASTNVTLDGGERARPIAYLARAQVGSRSFPVELIVPGQRFLHLGP
jgi:hypothetical protein